MHRFMSEVNRAAKLPQLPPHRRICKSIAFELKLGTGLCNGKGSPVVTLALRLHRDRLQQRVQEGSPLLSCVIVTLTSYSEKWPERVTKRERKQ